MPSDKLRNSRMGRAVRNATNSFLNTFTTSSPHVYGLNESIHDLAHVDKRSAHNALERQRREILNSKYQQLAHALPSLHKVPRPSKITIVARSLEFVSNSIEREKKLKDQLKDLRKKNERLRDQTQLSQSAMKHVSPPTTTVADTPLEVSNEESIKPMPALSVKSVSPATSMDTLKEHAIQKEKMERPDPVDRATSHAKAPSPYSVDTKKHSPVLGVDTSPQHSLATQAIPTYSTITRIYPMTDFPESQWTPHPPSPLMFDPYYYSPSETMISFNEQYAITTANNPPMTTQNFDSFAESAYMPTYFQAHLLYPSSMADFTDAPYFYSPLPYSVDTDRYALSHSCHLAFAA